MQSYIYIFVFLLGMIPPIPQINGYTHWSVSPNGMIIPITASDFSLRQPWNIITLFLQEDNCDFINTVEFKLNQVSKDLKSNHDYQKKVHSVYVDSNSACDKATKLLGEFDLHSTHILTLEAKGVASQTYLEEKHLKKLQAVKNRNWLQPFCNNFFNRTFSMCCFEHLESIRNRTKFEGVPEISLYKVALPQHLTPSEYGHLISLSLEKYHDTPTHNWVLYNMAAFYWRVKGSAKNSIECLRAALHTSPNKYIDVALVSLANILHLIKSASRDALILMKYAILISPHFSSHHIILGNIYASLGQFNESLNHFEMAAQLFRPEKDKIKLKDIEDRIFAARCSFELSVAISAQQANLQKQIKELDSFQHNTERYHDAKSSLDSHRVNNATQKKRQIIYEEYVDYEEMKTLNKTQCSKYDDNTNQIVDCNFNEKKIISDFFQDPISRNLEKTSNKKQTEFDKPKYQRRYSQLYSNEQILHQASDVDCTSIQCFTAEKKENYDMFMSIYLSPRNKGFDLLNVLTESQGLHSNQEHPLPWHPPYCIHYTDTDEVVAIDIIDNMLSVKQSNVIKAKDEGNPRVVNKRLFGELKTLVDHCELQLEDIGQRIVTAMTSNVAPLWITLNMAALYWRVIGNLAEAIDCQRLSAKLSPVLYRDVPMVNLAAILLTGNRTDDALTLVKAALQIDFSEPETHFLAAGLYQKYENYKLSYQHHKLAIRQDPKFRMTESDRNFLKCQICKKESLKSNTINSGVKNDVFRSISNVFIKYHMCLSIRECQNIISRKSHHLPHIKITVKGHSFSHTDIEGLSGRTPETMYQEEVSVSQIMYGLLWNTNVTNLYILEHDCVVTNDSVRTLGCHVNTEIHDASINAVKFLEELKCIVQNLSKHDSGHGFRDSDILKKAECRIERDDESTANDESQSQSKVPSQTLHDDIIKLISARVVLRPLDPEDCEQVAPFDFKTYTPLYVSLNTMQINVVALLDSLTPSYSFTFSHQPYCSPKGDNIFLQKILEKHKVNFETSQYGKVPEYNLHASFLKTFDDKYTLDEIGRRLYTGLSQNTSDWRLATITVNYWRVYGDANEAFKCLEVAMENSPDFHLKVILVNAANILYRINELEAALEVSYRALKCADSQNWIVIPFLIANIFATMEQWQKATLFYESCLSIKANFDEAIYRIKSIQCQQMVLTNLEQH